MNAIVLFSTLITMPGSLLFNNYSRPNLSELDQVQMVARWNLQTKLHHLKKLFYSILQNNFKIGCSSSLMKLNWKLLSSVNHSAYSFIPYLTSNSTVHCTEFSTLYMLSIFAIVCNHCFTFALWNTIDSVYCLYSRHWGIVHLDIQLAPLSFINFFNSCKFQ